MSSLRGLTHMERLRGGGALKALLTSLGEEGRDTAAGMPPCGTSCSGACLVGPEGGSAAWNSEFRPCGWMEGTSDADAVPVESWRVSGFAAAGLSKAWLSVSGMLHWPLSLRPCTCNTHQAVYKMR